MPASTDARAEVTRAGEALRFAGALSRQTVPALWKALPAVDGVRSLDLRAVTTLDSAGLALLSVVAERCGAPAIEGEPPGLAELRSAYRLDGQLGF
jgi:phospholipid transport system transporter-binding protein